MMLAEMTDTVKQAPPSKSASDMGKRAVPDAQRRLEDRIEKIEDITIRLHDLIRSPSLAPAAAGSEEHLKITEISAALDALKAELKAVRESERRPGIYPAAKAAPLSLVKSPPTTKKISRANVGKTNVAPPPLPVAPKPQPAVKPLSLVKTAPVPKKVDRASTEKTVVAAKPLPVAPKPQPPAAEKTAIKARPEQTPSHSETPKPKSETHQKIVNALAQINMIVNKQQDQY
ncbi:MAG: hypothetical protein A3G18_10640 [Rhodospirillales bacterium RIFCSPLOWO2_12_FULL_58_28]|nr:MAG: hypothetical protein A3H92_11000 [Rhodospirillales bacterium RIFCSPLOWO2_02_FULL_58_16]OHC77877.1 MAG: hypothetical protein A3G18_10640 [Rhodospirillales bacterium RIFCSPLOWO2_12_FULL_58_28]